MCGRSHSECLGKESDLALLARFLPTGCEAILSIFPLTAQGKREKASLLGCPICVSHPHTDLVSPGYFWKPIHFSVFRLAHRHLLVAPLAWLCKDMEPHGLAFCTVVYHHYLGNETATSLHCSYTAASWHFTARSTSLPSSQGNQQPVLRGPKCKRDPTRHVQHLQASRHASGPISIPCKFCR